MKKLFILILTFFAAAVSGCDSPGNERVNVIKGGGMANNSMMVGFSELCDGTSEGFLGSSENLLVSLQGNTDTEFYSFNVQSKKKSQTIPLKVTNGYIIEISSDGSRFICGNYLVNLQAREKTVLPEAKSRVPTYESVKSIPSYSFMGGNEVLYINPFYYIGKYYYSGERKGALSTLPSNRAYAILNVRDTSSPLEQDSFKSIHGPELSSFREPALLADSLVYLFIGDKLSTGEACLYSFDFYTKKFTLLDTDVISYRISPDGNNIAYIKNYTGSIPENKLFVISLDGKSKKELAGLNSIDGLCWSYNSRWIAYSGGDKPKNDIWITAADGSAQEQLTHGMYTASKLSWNRVGDKIAFTSVPAASPGSSKVYLISLNMPVPPENTESLKPHGERAELSRQLLTILKIETARIQKEFNLQ